MKSRRLKSRPINTKSSNKDISLFGKEETEMQEKDGKEALSLRDKWIGQHYTLHLLTHRSRTDVPSQVPFSQPSYTTPFLRKNSPLTPNWPF